ncbi:DegT/DnrJ/EryC1/StrS aminotransferase family protein [Candidatus Saccharibacteria bacterium]|nr:DegT/DnrJ/EryC1/StrS aminotransferase family protein [Candidatus Saccharibacteria bacterium]
MKYFLGLSSQYKTADVFRHTFALGDEYFLSELRAYLAARYGATVDHVAVYANGRTALSVALKALTKRGGKVVVTSLTCYAVVQAVKSAGLVPIFADVDRDTLHFGADELEKALEGEKDVQAVIVQNNLGIPVDIKSIEKVAKAHKLEIIEDLAHCAGVKYADGREVGTVGRAAVLSFGKGKSIDTITGGAVVFTNPMDAPVTQPENLPAKSEILRARFYPLLSLVIRAGYMLYPAVGKALTAGFMKMHAIKRSADGVVDPKLRLTYWQCRLALSKLQSLPRRGAGPIRKFYLVEDREDLLNRLEKAGYYFRDIWYTTPVAPERYFRKADFHPEACPVATELAKKIINVPTWYSDTELKSAMNIIEEHITGKPVEEPAEEKPAKKSTKKSKKKLNLRPLKKTKKDSEKEPKVEEPKKEEPKKEEPRTGARGDLVSDQASPKIAKGNAVMRQAPKKLTDREKLKLELEKGKKEGPSVI